MTSGVAEAPDASDVRSAAWTARSDRAALASRDGWPSRREGLEPSKKVVAPDASWVSQPRVDAQKGFLDEDGFWPINPDVAIEVKSRTDDWRVTVARIGTFIERGSTYAVAINPETRDVVPGGTLAPRSHTRLRCDH